MEDCQIPGGATLWARQTIDSEIFYNKPAEWFKIWFYLVNRVSHKNTKKYKRGETFLQYDWIREHTNTTKDQVKKCLAFLREKQMISTRRSTRGAWLEILNYSHYQRLDNYYYDVKAPHEALEKHQRSTREAPRYNKNDKNDKNDKKESDFFSKKPQALYYEEPDKETYKTKQKIYKQTGKNYQPPKRSDAQKKAWDTEKLAVYLKDKSMELHGVDIYVNRTKSSKHWKSLARVVKDFDLTKCKEMVDFYLDSEKFDKFGADPSVIFSDHSINAFLKGDQKPKVHDLTNLK